MFLLTTLASGSSCLLHRAKRDPDAFAAFYDAYHKRVFIFFARRLLDAETALDLMSETFARALQHKRQFRGETAEEEQAWLFAIARTELSRYWRRGRVEREALARCGVTVPELSDEELERIETLAGVAEAAKPLRSAMSSLPPDQRRAVELRVVDELGYEDVARLLEVSSTVARARVSRGLRRLAGSLQDAGVVYEDVA